MPFAHGYHRLLFAFVFLIGTALPAMALTEKERDHLRMLSEWLPYVSCQQGKFMKDCYLWSEEECAGSIAASSTSCLNMYQSQLFSPVTMSVDRWQDKLVDCVQRDIKAKLKGRSIISISCKNRGGG